MTGVDEFETNADSIALARSVQFLELRVSVVVATLTRSEFARASAVRSSTGHDDPAMRKAVRGTLTALWRHCDTPPRPSCDGEENHWKKSVAATRADTKLDLELQCAQHEGVVEYASITAALAILASSLAGVVGSVATLPATDAKATALVAAAATAHHVSKADARAAYAKAPYRLPVLRYFYAVGWVGAAQDRARCVAELLLGPKPSDAAGAAIKQTPKLLAKIRAAKITVRQASTALGRGATDGCA